MGWIWQEGKTGEKGKGKGKGKNGKHGNAGKPSAKGAGKDGNAGKPSATTYIYCKTPECSGMVFQGTKPVPEKCKVCHYCDVPFVFPNLGKGGYSQGARPKASNPIPADVITTAYDQLIANGMTVDTANGVLLGLGHVVPKPIAPKQPTDAFAKISKLNSEVASQERIIEQKKEKHIRLTNELCTLWTELEERETAVAELIATRTTQMAELPTTTTLFPTVNVKPPEVATYLRGVEADWEKLIEFGGSIATPDGQAPLSEQFGILRDRTLQACKLQHEHVAFPTDSLAADAAEIFCGSEPEIVEEGAAFDLAYEMSDADTAYPPLPDLSTVANRHEEVKRQQGLILGRIKKKARSSRSSS